MGNWLMHDGMVDLGLLPLIFFTERPETGVEQANARYAHGGGWRPMPKASMETSEGVPIVTFKYDDGEEVYTPLAEITLSCGDRVFLLEHSLVLILFPDGNFEVSRMD